MRRYFIKFSYIGTQYRGLQKSRINASDVLLHDTDSVQGALEAAFATVRPKCIRWPKFTASSRTDAGVHSLCSAAHVDLQEKYNRIYEPNSVLRYVNRYLISCKHSIRLLECIPVRNDFHARTLAKSRTYLYRFMVPKDPNYHRVPIAELQTCAVIRPKADFDIERMKRGTQLFVGTKDFRTFSAKSVQDTPIRYVRTLESLTLERGQSLMPYDPISEYYDYWNVTVKSKGFLYKQVRRMVGALFCLAEGKITEREIQQLLQVPGHQYFRNPLDTAPPIGLYLLNVEYCPEQVEEYIIKYKISPNEHTVIPVEDDQANEMPVQEFAQASL